MTDVALRKKKNADAQAAFRQRRANYIATLEETVTSLESVVLQLQDSCREARNDAGELRQENARLRHELREREKFWRALWQARKTGQVPDTDDIPSLPSTFPVQPQPNAMGYQTGDDSTSMSNGSYTPAPNHAYSGHSPSLSYPGVDNEHLPSSGTSHQMGSSRPSKFSQYPYPQTINRDGTWNHSMHQNTSSSGSPTLTSPEMYVNRSFVDEQKAPLSQLETTPYLVSGSRSISPSTSTPSSSSSTSLTSPFQFAFPENSGISQDRTEFDYRRHSAAHSAEVTLHGGTADLSLSSAGSEGVRYRIGPRRANSGPERPLLPSLPHFSGSEGNSHHERGSSEGEASSYSQHSKLRPRRGVERASRSPSPGAPPISGTLAVIKAQAFGALRRTRTRTKKSSDGAAKVALEVLEARGIGMGVMTGSKRPRLQNDHCELQT